MNVTGNRRWNDRPHCSRGRLGYVKSGTDIASRVDVEGGESDSYNRCNFQTGQ